MPINLETINALFKKFFTKRSKLFFKKITKKYKKTNYKNFEDKAKSQIGDQLYSAFIKKLHKETVEEGPKALTK